MIAALFEHGGWIVRVLLALSAVALAITVAKSLILFSYQRRLRALASRGESGGAEAREHALNHEALRLGRGLTTLRVIGSAAPLLGLLGTVIGLFQAFQAVAAEGLGDPRVFADGIALALTTTIAGLLVAVPTIAAHQYLVAAVERILVRLEAHLEVGAER